MKVDSINNNVVFGNKKGEVKYLRIIKDGNGNIRFINTSEEASNVRVFVAGGSEVDRKVREANIRILARCKEIPSKKKPKILTFINKLLRH